MCFNSAHFVVFLLVIYGAYLLWMRHRVVQNAILLIGSYYFYSCWDWRFLSLIWISTLVDFVCGRLLDRRGAAPAQEQSSDSGYLYSARQRKAILLVSVGVNLGILGFFKYYDFFAVSCAELLNRIGLGMEPMVLNVILPVGISFYTFQTLSYTIDIYRGQIRAHKSLLDFAVFVAFFPQLVAGPIVRARDFLPQVARARRLDLQQIYAGVYLIFWGLFKKMVIADNLAKIVYWAFRPNPPENGATLLIAVYAFAFQIYCDFSGYTDIARGCGRLMGFRLPINFNLPYFASNPVEFWRRWHISLSTWLRDYLYIPLGGNRKGIRRTCINLMLTMVLGGLWHGAAWTFVLWGVYHGVLLAGYKLTQPAIARLTQYLPSWTERIRHWFSIVVFFHLVCLGWLIFRAETIPQIWQMLTIICKPWPWWIICGTNTLHGTGWLTLLALVPPLVIVQLIQRYKSDAEFLLRCPLLVRALSYSCVFYALVCFGVRRGTDFIYFQF